MINLWFFVYFCYGGHSALPQLADETRPQLATKVSQSVVQSKERLTRHDGRHEAADRLL